MNHSLKRLACFLLSAAVCLSASTLLAKADTQPVSKTVTLTFNESQQQNQSQTVNLPNLTSVGSVTVDNGHVSYSQSGTNLTVNVSGGSPKRTYTPSKSASQIQSSTANSFPSSISYNDGTYSGTLNISGSSYISAQTLIGQPSGTFWWYQNDYGYSALTAANPPTAHDYLGGAAGPNPSDWPSEYTVIQYYWSGSITWWNSIGQYVRPCFIQYNHYQATYSQNYSGTVYAATQNYYSYTVTVNYEASYSKPALTVTADNSNNRINLNCTMSDTTQAYAYTVYRKGSSDQSFQAVASSLTGSSWTDSGGRDTAPPNAPNISGVSHNSDFSQYAVSYSSSDAGAAYQYYVEAVGQSDGTRIQSSAVSGTVITGMKGYSIVVDNNSGTVPGGAITTTASSYSFPKPASNGFYVHIISVDNAGNVSTVTNYHVDDFISVSHPISVNYSIDPNSNTPFTSPDIPITNNSGLPVSVTIEGLKAASGGSLAFADVDPASKSWNTLGLADSKKYIALGAEVKNSTGWNSGYNPGTFWSVNTSPMLIGSLNPSTAGTLTLTANSGLAFDNTYTAVHSLSFLFQLT